MIEAYLQSLLDAVAASPIVRASNVTLDKRTLYAYHYQAADAALIFRYDDTPHHPGLSTFPHHKHAGSETHVIPATPPDLPTVMQEIEAIHPLTS